ncbi:hypothetical protein GQ457_14G004430 [Hibiscus cannabinus]
MCVVKDEDTKVELTDSVESNRDLAVASMVEGLVEPNAGSLSQGMLRPNPGQQMNEDLELIVAKHTNETRVTMETSGVLKEAYMVSTLMDKGVYETKLFDKMFMRRVANNTKWPDFAEVGQGQLVVQAPMVVVLTVSVEIQRFGEMPAEMDTLVFQTGKSTTGAKQSIDYPSLTNMDQFLRCLKTGNSSNMNSLIQTVFRGIYSMTIIDVYQNVEFHDPYAFRLLLMRLKSWTVAVDLHYRFRILIVWSNVVVVTNTKYFTILRVTLERTLKLGDMKSVGGLGGISKHMAIQHPPLSDKHSRCIDNFVRKLGPTLPMDILRRFVNEAENETCSRNTTLKFQRQNGVQVVIQPITNRNIGNVHDKLRARAGVDEDMILCELKYEGNCIWHEENREAMQDFMGKELKNQLFVVMTYYPSVLKIPIQNKLSGELKQNIQEFEHAFGKSTIDSDLSREIRKKSQGMKATRASVTLPIF